MTSRNRQDAFSTGETPDRVPGGSRDGAAGGAHASYELSGAAYPIEKGVRL
jgi:hypothetical protein